MKWRNPFSGPDSVEQCVHEDHPSEPHYHWGWAQRRYADKPVKHAYTSGKQRFAK